jgi:hypothetical protein
MSVRIAESKAEVHGLLHVPNPVSITVLVARDRRKPALEGMANRTVPEEYGLALRIGQQLLRLRNRNIAPTDCAVLKSKIKRGILIGCEIYARLRLRPVAHGSDLNPVVPGRELLDPVMALVVGNNDSRYFRLQILRFDERVLKGCAFRPFHRSLNRCTIGEGSQNGNRAEQHENLAHF